MITITEIWNAVRTILNVVSQILGIASIISGQTAKAAQENVPFTIETNTAVTEAVVTDATFGNSALHATLTSMSGTLTAINANVLTILGDYQQRGQPVTLPATPPPAYTAPTLASIALAVWSFTNVATSQDMQELLAAAGIFALNLQNAGAIPCKADKKFLIWGDWASEASFAFSGTFPGVDWATVLPDDTALTWLGRELAGYPVALDTDTGLVNVDISGLGQEFAQLIYTEPEFEYWRDQTFGTLLPKVPPIWPGLAGVTLGTPVSLVDGLTLTDPLEGCIVAILSVPPGKAKYIYGSVTAFQHIGALSFEDDNSDQESFQALEFESQVYLPKSMVTAAGVRFKVNQGVTGTVTPFTIP